jgi:hypothetical protein
LSHSVKPFFDCIFFKIGSQEYLPRLALNGDPPDLCPLSN